MKPNQILPITAFIVLAVGFAGCAGEAGDASESGTAASGSNPQPQAFATFYPVYYFATRIAGDAIDVACRLPEDSDPAQWIPDRETIALYQSADFVFANGAGFEKWLDQVALPESRLVLTTRSFEDELMELEESVTHTHGPAGEHTHAGLDGSTWMDPRLAMRQAEEIFLAFAGFLPDREEELRENFNALRRDLVELDELYQRIGTALAGELLIASHPNYNYISRQYGWGVMNLHLEPDEMPETGNADIEQLKTAAAERGARFLLWGDQPLPEVTEHIQQLTHVESLLFSTAEGLPEDGQDYIEILRRDGQALLKKIEFQPTTN